MVLDLIWGKGSSFANFLQKKGLLPERLRNFLRFIAHFIFNDPPERIIELKNNFLMLTPEGHKGSRSYKNGTYEEALYSFLERHINENEVLIDIGAALGYYTLLFSKKAGIKGEVYAFEAESNAFSYLKKNTLLNNLTNVKLFNLALDEHAGESYFVKSCDLNIGTWGGYVSSKKSNFKVKTSSLDDFNLEKIDWIKLDVDGNEFKILKGMKNLIKSSKNLKLIMEFDLEVIYKNNSEIEIKNIFSFLKSNFAFAIVCEENYKYLDIRNINILEHVKGHKNLVFFR